MEKRRLRVLTTTDTDRQILNTIISALNVKVDEPYAGNYPVLFLNSDHKECLSWGNNRSSHFEDVDFPEFVKEVLKQYSKVATIVLNSDYSAIVDNNSKTVKVGCQTFSFDKVREIVKAME